MVRENLLLRNGGINPEAVRGIVYPLAENKMSSDFICLGRIEISFYMYQHKNGFYCRTDNVSELKNFIYFENCADMLNSICKTLKERISEFEDENDKNIFGFFN